MIRTKCLRKVLIEGIVLSVSVYSMCKGRVAKCCSSSLDAEERMHCRIGGVYWSVLRLYHSCQAFRLHSTDLAAFLLDWKLWCSFLRPYLTTESVLKTSVGRHSAVLQHPVWHWSCSLSRPCWKPLVHSSMPHVRCTELVSWTLFYFILIHFILIYSILISGLHRDNQLFIL